MLLPISFGPDPTFARAFQHRQGLDAARDDHGLCNPEKGGRGASPSRNRARLVRRCTADSLRTSRPRLDGVTADEVRSALLDAARGKTLIVATHDADLAGRMDRIVTLCEGSVEEIAS